MFGGKRRKRREAEELAVDEEVTTVDDDAERDFGPYDSSEAPDDGLMRLDLGSLKIPALPGLKIGMPADDRGRLRQEVMISTEDSRSGLRLAVCAAPRSEGIWDEVREEIAAAVAKQGGEAVEEEGRYGTELVAQQPTGQGTVVMRYIGIDGPRWFVRALFQGERASGEATGVLDDCLSKLVVERGVEAMPVRESLPLQLPAQMLEEHKKRVAAQQQQAAMAAAGAATGSRPVNGANGSGGGRSTGRGGRPKPSPKPRKR